MKTTRNEIQFQSYQLSTKENFPVDECVVPYKTERHVFHSESWYECVMADLRFPTDSYVIDYCKPYIWKSGDIILYGWDKSEASTFDGDYWDNIENPVRNGYVVVVAFRKVDMKEIEAAFEFKEKIAKHGLECQIWDD